MVVVVAGLVVVVVQPYENELTDKHCAAADRSKRIVDCFLMEKGTKRNNSKCGRNRRADLAKDFVGMIWFDLRMMLTFISQWSSFPRDDINDLLQPIKSTEHHIRMDQSYTRKGIIPLRHCRNLSLIDLWIPGCHRRQRPLTTSSQTTARQKTHKNRERERQKIHQQKSHDTVRSNNTTSSSSSLLSFGGCCDGSTSWSHPVVSFVHHNDDKDGGIVV